MDESGKSLAVTAETLYLLNLLLVPGLAFAVLLVIYVLKKKQADPLAANHLSQTIGVSIIGGALIVMVIGLVIFFGGFDSGYTWVVVVLYFTFIHSSLILMGVMGLVKALNAEHYSYPLIGKYFQS
jgi:uncharacterized Tic20 family protein